MSSDAPDTVQVDHDAEPPPLASSEDDATRREWYESPWLWAAGVVVLLLSIPLLLELTGGGRKAAPRTKALLEAPASAATTGAALETGVPDDAAEPSRSDAGRPPPRATPPSVQPRAPEPARQTVIKCMEKNGRIVYTQTGACSGSMVPVPIDADHNVVDSPLPARSAASR